LNDTQLGSIWLIPFNVDCNCIGSLGNKS
jgi:hypothetical protein